MNALLGHCLSVIAPRILGVHGKNRLATLIYHRVLPDNDPMRPYEVTADQFEQQMALISKFFKPVSVQTALAGLRDNTLPENAVCVTFDDGYADNFEVALPILEKYAIPATVFVSTGYLNGGRMWNDTVLESFRLFNTADIDLTELGLQRYRIGSDSDRYQAAVSVLKEIKHWPVSKRLLTAQAIGELAGQLPCDLMLTDAQVIELSGRGVEIGAHTVTHPILANLDMQESENEIFSCRQYLEKLLGKQVKYFAYPNGRPEFDYKDFHVELVKAAGYEAAFSTTWGVACKASDRWQLARFTPWDSSSLKFMVRLLMNYRNVV